MGSDKEEEMGRACRSTVYILLVRKLEEERTFWRLGR
jgi:hypothetical protein